MTKKVLESMIKSMDKSEFKIENVMKVVKQLRNGFTLESDFQFTMGKAIEAIYGENNNFEVIMEYKVSDSITDNEKDKNEYLDILVIMNKKYIPIELKYKHSKCSINLFDENEKEGLYDLSDQSCRKTIRKSYVDDICRIEKFKDKKIKSLINGEEIEFDKGYAILLTNYYQFRNTNYDEDEGKYSGNYSLHSTEGENKGYASNIKDDFGKRIIKEPYEMFWEDYHDNIDTEKVNKDNRNKFIYLITTIKK